MGRTKLILEEVVFKYIIGKTELNGFIQSVKLTTNTYH